jgi:hypothetical protein
LPSPLSCLVFFFFFFLLDVLISPYAPAFDTCYHATHATHRDEEFLKDGFEVVPASVFNAEQRETALDVLLAKESLITALHSTSLGKRVIHDDMSGLEISAELSVKRAVELDAQRLLDTLWASVPTVPPESSDDSGGSSGEDDPAQDYSTDEPDAEEPGEHGGNVSEVASATGAGQAGACGGGDDGDDDDKPAESGGDPESPTGTPLPSQRSSGNLTASQQRLSRLRGFAAATSRVNLLRENSQRLAEEERIAAAKRMARSQRASKRREVRLREQEERRALRRMYRRDPQLEAMDRLLQEAKLNAESTRRGGADAVDSWITDTDEKATRPQWLLDEMQENVEEHKLARAFVRRGSAEDEDEVWGDLVKKTYSELGEDEDTSYQLMA